MIYVKGEEDRQAVGRDLRDDAEHAAGAVQDVEHRYVEGEPVRDAEKQGDAALLSTASLLHLSFLLECGN